MKLVYSKKWYVAVVVISTLTIPQASLIAQPCIEPAPIILGDTRICAHSAALYQAPDITGTTYHWSVANGSISGPTTDNTLTIMWGNTGIGTVTLTLTTSAGCDTTITVPVTINTKPNADFSYSHANPTAYSGEDTVRFTNTSTGINTYLWNFGDGKYDTSYSIGHLYQQPGTYTVLLQVTNPASLCENTISKTLEIKAREDVYIPSAFTPNGDGLNDVFAIALGENMEVDIQVFDRLGETIYHATDPQATWDGTFKGERVPSDAYNYVVTGKSFYGNKFSKTGTVLLLR